MHHSHHDVALIAQIRVERLLRDAESRRWKSSAAGGPRPGRLLLAGIGRRLVVVGRALIAASGVGTPEAP